MEELNWVLVAFVKFAVKSWFHQPLQKENLVVDGFNAGFKSSSSENNTNSIIMMEIKQGIL